MWTISDKRPGGIGVPGFAGKPIQRSPSRWGKLRHLERECIAVAQRFGVLQRIVKARDAFANSRHPLMERHDGERVAILNRRARGQRPLNLGQHSADGSVAAPRSCCRTDA